MSSTVTVRPDGSGTVTERLTLRSQFAEMMRKMEQMDDSTAPSAALFTRDEIQARADSIPGLRLSSVEMLSDGQMEGYEAVFAFDNLNDVNFNPSPGKMLPDRPDSDDDDGDAPFELLRNVQFSHSPGSPATLSVTMPRSDPADIGMDTSGDDSPSEQEIGMMREMMRDSGFRLAVSVDGEIVETNASHRSGSTITLMEMDFGALAQDSTAFRRVMVEEDASASSRAAIERLNAMPGITIEPEQTVTIRYR